MQVLFGRLIQWISGTISTAWLAHTTLFTVGIMSAASIMLYGVILYFIQDALNTAMSYIQSVQVPQYNLVSIGSYLLCLLKIPQCLGVVIDLSIIRFVAKKIPFIKW